MKKLRMSTHTLRRFRRTFAFCLRNFGRLSGNRQPDAEEVISYAMPGYKLNGMLVFFAGYARHIGFYPGAGGITEFKTELAGYKSAKGSVQFPLDQPLPLKLVEQIVKFRVKQNLERAKLKEKKNKK